MTSKAVKLEMAQWWFTHTDQHDHMEMMWTWLIHWAAHGDFE